MFRKYKSVWVIVLIAISFLGLSCSCSKSATTNTDVKTKADTVSKIVRGKGIRIFDAYKPLADRKVNIHYFIPDNVDMKTAPIMIVCHGTNRNADTYLNVWVPHAKEKGFMIFAPEFSASAFPEDDYILGRVFINGTLQPEANWTYSIIDPIFDLIRREIGSTRNSYDIYGHSAGAQFVHRLLLFKPDAKVNRAIAANAGWYTVPDYTVSFPHGIKNAPVTENHIKTFMSKKLYILLGTKDTNPNDPNLNNTPASKVQGPHRFARGYYFWDKVNEIHENKGYPLNWEIKNVEGAAHSNAQMAPGAVKVLY